MASGLTACMLALALVAFLPQYLQRDPIAIAEWRERGRGVDLASYVAYDTMAGGLGHLIVIGLGFGFPIGALGGLMGLASRIIRTTGLLQSGHSPDGR